MKKITLRLTEPNKLNLEILESKLDMSLNSLINYLIDLGVGEHSKNVKLMGGTVTAGGIETLIPKSSLSIKTDKVIFINSKGEEFEVVLKPNSSIKITKND